MNESTARNIRVQDRYDELMRIGRHGHYETMFQVVREEIESLRQQLASCDAEIERLKTVPMRYRRMAFNAQLQDENAQLSQQLADSQKQVTLLREAMQGAWKDGYCFVGPEGQTDEQKAFEQALAATADLKDVILCHAEPVAWLHGKRPDSDVITDAVKNVWNGAVVGEMAQYSIPLYSPKGLK